MTNLDSTLDETQRRRPKQWRNDSSSTAGVVFAKIDGAILQLRTGSSVQETHEDRPMDKSYPDWLNRVSWAVLPVVPVGLILLLLGFVVAGSVIIALGFLGIWVFGSVAARLKRGRGPRIPDGRSRRGP